MNTKLFHSKNPGPILSVKAVPLAKLTKLSVRFINLNNTTLLCTCCSASCFICSRSSSKWFRYWTPLNPVEIITQLVWPCAYSIFKITCSCFKKKKKLYTRIYVIYAAKKPWSLSLQLQGLTFKQSLHSHSYTPKLTSTFNFEPKLNSTFNLRPFTHVQQYSELSITLVEFNFQHSFTSVQLKIKPPFFAAWGRLSSMRALSSLLGGGWS